MDCGIVRARGHPRHRHRRRDGLRVFLSRDGQRLHFDELETQQSHRSTRIGEVFQLLVKEIYIPDKGPDGQEMQQELHGDQFTAFCCVCL